MRQYINFFLICVLSFTLAALGLGCGYTTRGFLDPQYRSIYIKPAVNAIGVTGETQEYSNFRSVPPFLDNSFTKALISRFTFDGNLKVTREGNADLVLECTITDFVRSTLRYDNQDRVEEYRLKINFDYKLYNTISQEVIKHKSLIADSEYALVGSVAKTEDQALTELLEEAARKVTEDIVEAW
ncbi:MAG: LptE family protein [Candidatus Omnitrophica bacterium]|nr:LptE family protein [Candidatus Omnitrophota bacterium]